jgi:hypothetical protein
LLARGDEEGHLTYMLLDLIITTVLTVAATGSGYALGKRKAKVNETVEPIEDSSISWAWDYKREGFNCPKCKFTSYYDKLSAVDNTVKQKKPRATKKKSSGHLPYCECPEYHDEHFHFKCKECGFAAIMRTADK